MKFNVQEFISDKYAKAINILKENLKENYHVFYGIRLSEVLFPASEYGSDAFYREFEVINSVTLPLLIIDLKERKPMLVIGFEGISCASLLEDASVSVLVCDNLSDLLILEELVPFFD
ncbi:hypothetical protein BJ925_0324 [Rahnella aquatilis]|nr:hypothetical protein BJ925_0324 [Rahnella aquatilis]